MAVRYARLWPLVVLALALLFTQLEPEPTRALPWLAAWAVWTVHIGLGLMLAVLATRATARFSGLDRRGPWPRLLLGGVLGSLAFAPLALGFERVFPVPIDGAADGLLGRWEAAGGVLALLAEWLQLAPSYLITWCLLNLVPLAPALVGTEAPAPASAPVDAGPPIDADPAGDTAEPGPTPSEPEIPAADASAGEVFFSTLPVAIGRDLVRIDADLHYLQVRTALGRATVLGSLAEVEAALAHAGLRVHRSHWVAFAHLRRVSKSAKGWACELRNGDRVPISRRRLAEVRERLGSGFVIDPMG
ncbi:MAG: LytTR family DNA-binding domain-containing protein [Lysobacteraceae bacterium]